MGKVDKEKLIEVVGEEMFKEMIEVVECPHCGRNEYYGLMTFYRRGSTMLCRRCIKHVWRKEDGWLVVNPQYEFPYFDDGIDYTRKGG